MKGQELPINVVVLIIIALIILVLAIFFIVLPILHTPVQNTNTTQTGFAQFQLNCGSYCPPPETQNLAPPQTQFCTATYGNFHCWSPYNGGYVYDGGSCAYQAANGTRFVADQQTC